MIFYMLFEQLPDRTLPIAAFLLVGAAALFAQNVSTFRATSELVTLDVQVLHNKTGAPSPPLQGGDFQILEESAPQSILHFSHDEYPLSVVLLFDLTESVRGVLKRLAEGAESALEHFKPSDEVAVMVYSSDAALVSGFTTNRARTRAAVERAVTLPSHGPAYFNEAIYQAATRLCKASNGTNRRVIIWLTDNLPNIPFRTNPRPHTEAEAVRTLNEQGVTVAAILLRSPKWEMLTPFARAAELPYEKSLPPGDAHKYASLTGGQAVGLRGKNPEDRLAQLIDELHARYTIAYRPSDPQPAGTFRKIRVALMPSSTLQPKEWTVLARQGYYRK